jgi:anaerobic selenocysteine-containing dehydrogenase/Fe-S-cluster-containing dehydrogenase component
MNRRTFLKLAGMGSIAFAAGCTAEPEKRLYTLVHAPDDMVPGQARWYASTCRECPAGCGVLAKNREGRVIKVEGNPLHPINQGTLCMRGQAALQGIYNPDRLTQPLLKKDDAWTPIDYQQARALLKQKVVAAAQRSAGNVSLVSEVTGGAMLALMREALAELGGPEPLIYEPFAYETLKSAHEAVFDVEALPAFHMEQADLLVSFGADFLETWLSPVEYARKFKKMHAIQKSNKGRFEHISPCQTLTAANADRWTACRPESETDIVLGLMGQALQEGRGDGLSRHQRERLDALIAPYSAARVSQTADITEATFNSLVKNLLSARQPLVLGSSSAAANSQAFRLDAAVALLNQVLDPELTLYDFARRHRMEIAARRSEVMAFFKSLANETQNGVLLLNQVNPAFTLPPDAGIHELLQQKHLFVVCFTNFMHETAALADLIIPIQMPLETWDEYAGKSRLTSILQPAMGPLTAAPALGDLILATLFKTDPPAPDYRTFLVDHLMKEGRIRDAAAFPMAVQSGGIFEKETGEAAPPLHQEAWDADLFTLLDKGPTQNTAQPLFSVLPSIRFFDGRGANRPWLCEIPDPVTKVAWQTTVSMHPDLMARHGLAQGDVAELTSAHGTIEAPVYANANQHPLAVCMSVGQGHGGYGRYARDRGVNPLSLLGSQGETPAGHPVFTTPITAVNATGRRMALAHTDGSRSQQGRKIALSVDRHAPYSQEGDHGQGLSMNDFPFTLPLPEGYDAKRDFFPPHPHEGYRWAMVVDLDRCIGCAACAAACYAENNLGVVGEAQIINGREMSWMRIERYQDQHRPERMIFLPMLCQHCDNAPCESVCPVFAPHHSKEGLNNQVYNRCIGTRFCAQNCPYKVRRFNWFDWQWPHPMELQLNPDVTVRSKGVMEKCSFCIQRIKDAHNVAKNENRTIGDGEVTPACVQTCPTRALAFGDLMNPKSHVRRLTRDPRAYQVMGYLNVKPAVIYLKKVL